MAWKLKLKGYPHFDPPVSAEFAESYVSNPENVIKHSFWPFIKFSLRWTKFAPKGTKGAVKEREIKYAARLDSYIFSYYRFKLSKYYEQFLEEKGLTENVLAYRKILNPDGGGKCNIDFAKEAFDLIKCQKNCTAYAIDISKFFENLDHSRLKLLWQKLLGVSRLPDDDMKVFKAITKYTYVEKKEAYKRLGLFHEDETKGYVHSPQKMTASYTKLCSSKDFREKIAGEGGTLPSIIHKNPNGNKGVPQGAPLSDLLANLYMTDADMFLKQYAEQVEGHYMRYSDDILLIVPSQYDAKKVYEDILGIVKKYCGGLNVSAHKTAIIKFEAKDGKLCSKRVYEGVKDSTELTAPVKDRFDGLEYLGFRFDGNGVYVRNSTISNLDRKVTKAARRAAFTHVHCNENKSEEELVSSFNFEFFIKKFSQVEDFQAIKDDPSNWTFWSYIRRSISVFGKDGIHLYRQFKGFRQRVRKRMIREIGRAYRTVHKEELEEKKKAKNVETIAQAMKTFKMFSPTTQTSSGSDPA